MSQTPKGRSHRGWARVVRLLRWLWNSQTGREVQSSFAKWGARLVLACVLSVLLWLSLNLLHYDPRPFIKETLGFGGGTGVSTSPEPASLTSYEKLASLPRSGQIRKVHALFGSPSHRTVELWETSRGKKKTVSENFEGDGYWLQVIYDKSSGNVLGWVVNACETDFKPTFKPYAKPIVIWQSTISEAEDAAELSQQDLLAGYSLGATGGQPSGLYEFGRQAEGRASVAQTFGFADVCGRPDKDPSVDLSSLRRAPPGMTYVGKVSRCVRDVAEQNDNMITKVEHPKRTCSSFGRVPVNMYGEYYVPYDDDVQMLTCKLGIGTGPGIGYGPERRGSDRGFPAGRCPPPETP